jgi:general secretion pathway protein C
MASPTTALGAARVVVATRDGRREPRVYGVRDGSVLDRLGLRNGDVLRSLDGHDLSDPDAVLEAYAALERARSLSLTVVRDGAPQTLQYAFER